MYMYLRVYIQYVYIYIYVYVYRQVFTSAPVLSIEVHESNTSYIIRFISIDTYTYTYIFIRGYIGEFHVYAYMDRQISYVCKNKQIDFHLCASAINRGARVKHLAFVLERKETLSRCVSAAAPGKISQKSAFMQAS